MVAGTPLPSLGQREFSCKSDIGHLKHETFDSDWDPSAESQAEGVLLLD